MSPTGHVLASLALSIFTLLPLRGALARSMASVAPHANGPSTLVQIGTAENLDPTLPPQSEAHSTATTTTTTTTLAPPAAAATPLNSSHTYKGIELRRLSKDSLSSLPSTEERVYSIVTQSDAIKGFKNYIVKGEYLPCDYQGCLMYACGYCKKTSGMLATTSFTCPSVKLVRDDHQRTIMQTHAGDFCDLAPKEKIDHFEDRTCPAILGLGKGVPPAQAYSEQLIRVKPYKGANPRVTAQFAAKKEEDITGRLPVLKDGTVDCTHLLLHFEAGQPPPVPINPLWSPGGEAFPPPPADGSPPTPQTVYANGQPAAPGGGQLDANHPLAQGPMNLSRSYTFSLHYVVFIMSTMLLFLSTS